MQGEICDAEICCPWGTRARGVSPLEGVVRLAEEEGGRFEERDRGSPGCHDEREQ